MAGQARIVHALDPAFEETRDLKRILALAADAQVERFQALEHHPGIERAQCRAGVAGERQQGVGDEILGTAHRTCEHAALTVHHLGGAVGDDIRAEIHRPLQHVGGKGIVDDAGDAARAGDIAHRLHVDDVHRRVGGRFEEEHLGVGADRRLPLVELAPVDDRGLDAELGQQRIGQPAA